MRKDIHSVSARTMQQLLEYDWPGNVRELQNVLERAVILSEASTLEISALDHRRQAPAGHHRRPLLALPATSPASPAITSSAFSRRPTGSSAALRVLPLGSA